MFQSIDKGCLRSQSFLFPATIFLKYILNAVVQAAFPPLPEFEAGRSYGKTTPVVGTSDFMSRQLADLFYESPHNLHTTTYHPALRRNSCTYLAFIGSAGKVSIRHLVEAFFGFPVNVPVSSNLGQSVEEVNTFCQCCILSFQKKSRIYWHPRLLYIQQSKYSKIVHQSDRFSSYLRIYSRIDSLNKITIYPSF